jgi:hypothetical protein
MKKLIKAGGLIGLMLMSAAFVYAIESGIALDANKDEVKRGQWLTFFAELDIKSNVPYALESFSFEAAGSVCVFEPNGEIISGCSNIQDILAIPVGASYGYGYHFGEQRMKYKIVLDTADLELGQNSAMLVAHTTSSGTFESNQFDFDVVERKKWVGPKKTK